MTLQHLIYEPAGQGPLHGLRVIDMSRLVAGNMLSLQLADFGADVIKVEPPEGDPLRDWKEDGRSFFWDTYARNKRSVCLNLRDHAQMAAFTDLLHTADVLIENFRPGTLEQMGLGPDHLLALHPRLIVVRISGFGQTGPYAHLPGFGTIVEAMSGFADRTGFPDREPVLPPLALADMIAGLYGASAVMTALYARDIGGGQGQIIDLSLLESIFSIMGPEAGIFAHTGTVKQRAGSASNTAAPRNVYLCRDGGYVALSGSTQSITQRIFATIGRPEMTTDPRFATNSDRIRNRALVDAALGEWFVARDRDDAVQIMRDAGVTVGPVYDIRAAMADPHFQDRAVIVALDDPAGGVMPMHNVVPRLSATPGLFRLPAPTLGQHTAEILAEIGYDPTFRKTV